MTTRRLRDERGQGTLELVGITLLAAILVGALVLAVGASDSRIAASVRSNVCTIVTAGQGECGEVADAGAPVEAGPQIPTYLDPALTPEERAESGEYVALGDSFSSGEGGSEYDPDTDVDEAARAENYWDTHDEDGTPKISRGPGANDYNFPTEDPHHNLCHRSTGAYPQLVDDGFDFAGGYTFAACSGAVTSDFTNPNGENVDQPDEPWLGNDGEPAQLDHLDEDTSLVTFSIGGNDANFAGTLKGCISAGLNPAAQCLDDADERERAEEDIAGAIDNLRTLLPQVREAAPNARILVVGYPRFFPEDPGSGWSDGTQIDTEDIIAINELVADMDGRISDLVDELNEQNPGSYEFVDVYDAFDGCEIGTSDPCMNNISTRWADGKPDTNGSYHPNDRGHQRMAEITEEVVRSGP